MLLQFQLKHILMNLNNICPDIFVINLDRREDRLENCKIQAAQLGFSFERIPAIDGREVFNFTNLRPGENALNLSHLLAIDAAKHRGYKQTIVLEDDAEFVPDFNKKLALFYEVPLDWDLVYFGANLHHLGAGRITEEKVTDSVVKVYSAFTTHAMLIKDTVYDFVINEINNATAPLDIIYGQVQRKFNAYAFTPSLIKQTDGFSDIINFSQDYNSLGVFD